MSWPGLGRSPESDSQIGGNLADYICHKEKWDRGLIHISVHAKISLQMVQSRITDVDTVTPFSTCLNFKRCQNMYRSKKLNRYKAITTGMMWISNFRTNFRSASPPSSVCWFSSPTSFGSVSDMLAEPVFKISALSSTALTAVES